jgi:type VI secretion system protein ImpH
MASTNGQTPDSLTAKLGREPYAFDFHAAVRLLQSQARDLPRIGHSWSPAQDPVRFAQSPALDFAPSTLERFQGRDNARAPVLYSRHFGLFGANGPLPLCLTEFARQRILHQGDTTFAAFCNVFHHRLVSFLFRAWADAQKTVDYDRSDQQNWTYYIGSLVGLGMDSLLDKDAVPDRAKLYFSGRLAQQNRNAEGLEAIVREFFGIPVELQTFVGRWMDLPSDSICKLGVPANSKLGSTAIAGARVWTCQHHFQLRFGPMNLPAFERMLPNGSSFRRLRDWVRLFAGEHYSWDVVLILERRDIPRTQLGRSGRLGWNTWSATVQADTDAEVRFAA